MNDYNKKFKKVLNQFVNAKQFSISTSKCVISSSCSQTKRFFAPLGQKYLSFIYSEGYPFDHPKMLFKGSLYKMSLKRRWRFDGDIAKKQTAKFFVDTVNISFHLSQK